MSYVDRTFTCRDCGKDFIFTAGEQEFFAQKGFVHDPVRCPSCRRVRRQTRTRRPQGGMQGGERGRGGGGGRERVQHEVVCSKCGKTTTVPFAPRQDRQVYCPECFQAIRQQQDS